MTEAEFGARLKLNHSCSVRKSLGAWAVGKRVSEVLSNDFFTADAQPEPASTLVTLSGELDMSVQSQLRDRLEEVIEPGVSVHGISQM